MALDPHPLHWNDRRGLLTEFCAYILARPRHRPRSKRPQPQRFVLSGRLTSLHELSVSFEELAAHVRPAVVQIFSTGYVAADDSESTATASLIAKQQATGSGAILTADGYIVTNNHVMQGAWWEKSKCGWPTSNASVRATARRPHGGDEADRHRSRYRYRRDQGRAAAICPSRTLADPQALRQGQVVMAFGNPLGLEGSVSTGIVSSVARRLKADDPMVYVQTDAPINPGNSGGPLPSIPRATSSGSTP